MKVSTEKIEQNQVVLNVEVDPETVERSLDQAHRRLVNRLNIPGFRRGKAPRSMVERFVGRSALLEEALDRLVPEVYQKVIADEQIDAVAQPTFEITRVDPVTFKATVPVRPEIELGDYHAIRVEVDPDEIAESAIDEQIESLREQQAVWEPVERPAELGDQVTIDLESKQGEEPLADQKNIDYPLREDLRVPVPGFAVELVGLSSGETKEFELSFPEDHENPSLAGQTYKFKVTVHEIKARQLPEVTDEFAKDLSEELPTVAELRARIESNLRQRKASEVRAQAEEKTIDAVLEIATFELAPPLVEREIDRLIEDREQALARQNISMETYLQITRQTPDQMRDDLRAAADRRLRRNFVLDEIAKREGFEPPETELAAQIAVANAVEANQHVGHKHKPRDFNDPELRRVLAGALARDQALRWLIESATEGRFPANEAATDDEATTATESTEPADASGSATSE